MTQTDDIAAAPTVSATVPDFTREQVFFGKLCAGGRLIRALRLYQRWRGRAGPFGKLIRVVAKVRHTFWSLVSGAELPLTTHVAGGLCLPHPNGVVIHPDAVIGPNCMIFQQVTIGVAGDTPGVPTIGGHVDIGTGAKVLGPITIGNHARIGANAVVLCDVPPGATAVGVPARIIPAR